MLRIRDPSLWRFYVVCLFVWLVLFCFVSFVCSLFDFIGCDYKRHFKMVCSQATMVSTPHLMAILMGKLLFASMGIWVCHIGTKRWRLKLRLHTLISMIHHCLTYDFTILYCFSESLITRSLVFDFRAIHCWGRAIFSNRLLHQGGAEWRCRNDSDDVHRFIFQCVILDLSCPSSSFHHQSLGPLQHRVCLNL